MSTDTAKKIRRAALNKLARRDYADTELKSRLIAAGFEEADIDPVLIGLTSEKLLSNTRFIENYIYFRRKKGFGPLRIMAELLQKGLTEDTVHPHLNAHDPSWLTDIRQVWIKRFGGKNPTDFPEKAKQMRFLQARGFTGEQMASLFK